MKDQKEKQFSGVVVSFNVSPKGYYEGLLLQSDDDRITVQLNYPPDAGAAVAGLVAAGDKVKASAIAEEADDRPSDHAVLKLISISSAGGKTIFLSGPHQAKPVHSKGVVARLNYARHGEPNGAILENGDFVHLKPHGAKAIKAEVGQQLDAKGHGWPMLSGGNVIEADSVNGIELSDHKKDKHKEKHEPKAHKHAAGHL